MEQYWKRKRFGRRSLMQGAGLVGAGSVGLWAVGCGDDDDKPSGGTTPSSGGGGTTPASGGTTSGGGATATAAPQISGFEWIANKPDLTLAPKPGGSLKYGTYIRAASLDFTKGSSFETANIITPVYNRLFRPKYGAELQPYNPWKFELTPDLAASSETPAACEVVIKLKPNVKWQNVAPVSGRAFTSDDVKFTLEAFLAQPEFKTGGLLPIDKVDAVDPATVRLTLKAPINYILPALAEMRMVMMPKETFADWNTKAIGTGPFILDQYTANTSAHYKKNPDYFVQGKPYVNEIEYVTYKDETSAIAAYSTGQFPAGRGDGLGNADQYKKTAALPNTVAMKLQSRWQSNVWYLALKGDKAPFNDPRVAQALSKAYDRLAWSKLTYEPNGLTPNILGNFTWVDWFDKEPDLSAVTKADPTGAKQLLSAAGISGSLNATLDYANYGQSLVDQMQFIVEQLKPVGINLTMKETQVAAYSPFFNGGQFEQMALGFIQTVPRYAPIIMKTFLGTGEPRNALKLSDPEIDAAVKTLTESTETAAQKSAYQAVWNKAHLRPYLLTLLESQSFQFHDKKVHNWLFNQYSDPSGWGLQAMFEQLWLDA